MHPLVNIALKVVYSTTSALTREFDRIAAYPLESLGIVEKLCIDLETKIMQTIQEAYPRHQVLFPGGTQKSNAETTWLIDILSGLENYTRSIPHFAICIAIQHQDKIEHAIIHDPLLNETFMTSRNKPAQLNKFRIHVNESKTFSSQFFLAGNQAVPLSGYDPDLTIRHTGCNALMLAYVAAGRFDGFAGNGLTAAELAAGSLLIKSAGGAYSDLTGGNAYTVKGLLAANLKLFKLLLQAMGDTR